MAAALTMVVAWADTTIIARHNHQCAFPTASRSESFRDVSHTVVHDLQRAAKIASIIVGESSGRCRPAVVRQEVSRLKRLPFRRRGVGTVHVLPCQVDVQRVGRGSGLDLLDRARGKHVGREVHLLDDRRWGLRVVLPHVVAAARRGRGVGRWLVQVACAEGAI